jgi:predicted ATPase
MPTLLSANEVEALQRQVQGTTRERMLRELGAAVEVITAERPLVLWLEDLHWSDVSTLELLAWLARLDHLPGLVLAYVRRGRVEEGLAVLAEAQTLGL